MAGSKGLMRRLIWLAAVLPVLVALSTLAPTFLIPPKDLIEHRAVFVIDHGTHSSLAIESASGAMLRFAYGDARYYANRDTSVASGALALLVPTPATLGRAELLGPATKSNLLEQLVVAVEKIYPLQVESSRADQLIAKLDAIHEAGKASHIAVPAYGLVFAPHPKDYSWAHNSSTIVKDWLQEMEVEVFGWGLIASWELASD